MINIAEEMEDSQKQADHSCYAIIILAKLFMGKVFQIEVLTLPIHKFSFFLESLEYTMISSPVSKLRYRQSGPK